MDASDDFRRIIHGGMRATNAGELVGPDAAPGTRILAQLKRAEGRHLVIVRYGPRHSPHSEWVYNEADIDGAKVVWAREMDRAQNGKLLEYFKDRHVWLVEVDKDHSSPELTPYPVGPST